MRALRYLLVTTVALIAVVAIAVLALASTNRGFVWLTENVDDVVPGELVLSQPAGNLWGGVSIGQLSYRLDDISLDVQRLQLRLNWLALLAAEVRLTRVTADSVTIGLAESDAPAASGLPDVDLPLALRLVNVEVARLRYSGSGLDETVEAVMFSGAMRGSRLQVRDLRARARGVAMKLVGRIRFTRDWPLEFDAEWQQLGGQKFSGAARADGDLQKLVVTQIIDIPERVAIDATLRDLIESPRLDASAEWKGLSLPAEEAGPVMLGPGQLTVSGSLDDYQTSLTTKVLADELPDAELAIDASGTAEALRIDSLAVRAISGVVTGAGDLDYSTLSVSLSLQAEGLDLSVLQPNLPDQFAAVAALDGQLPDNLNIDVPAATLGWAEAMPINASGRLSLQDGVLRASNLRFAAADNSLDINGQVWPAPAIDFDLAASALDQLSAEVAGQILAVGRIAGSLSEPDISVAVTADDFRWQAFTVGRLSADIRSDEKDGLRVALSGGAMTREGVQLDDLQLDAAGALNNIDFSLLASGPAGRITLTGLTAIDDQSLSITAQTGEVALAAWNAWRLDGGLKIRIDGISAALSAHCWRSEEASLCAEDAGYRADQLYGAARLNNLSLATLPQIAGVDYGITGVADANVNLSGTVTSPTVRLLWSQVETQLSWRDAAETTFSTEFPEFVVSATFDNSALRYVASVRSTDGIEFDLDGSTGALQGTATRIDATVRAAIPDLKTLGPVIERFVQLQDVTGELRSEFRVSCALDELCIEGEGRITDGAAEVRATGIEVSDINLHVRDKGKRKLSLEGSARSGAGQITLNGEASLLADSEVSAFLNIVGDQFEALRFPQQTVAVSPDLQLRFSQDLLSLTGSVFVPTASVAVDALPTSAIAPSSDVIVIRDAEQAPASRSAIMVVTDLAVKLGDDVRLQAFGLSTRLGGSLQLITTAENQQPTVEGSLRSIDGTFAAYGRELNIERGVLIFSGVADNPNVDVRAVRNLRYQGQDIKIGVQLTGPLNAMETRLFGEPAMSESDALSYLVLNRPMQRSDSLDSEELSGAAVALGMVNLLPVTDDLRDTLGLDEVKFEGNTRESSSIVAGKNIGEDFYIRYSYSLFDRIGRFIVRYDIGRGFSLEAGSGLEQTIDLLYSIDR